MPNKEKYLRVHAMDYLWREIEHVVGMDPATRSEDQRELASYLDHICSSSRVPLRTVEAMADVVLHAYQIGLARAGERGW